MEIRVSTKVNTKKQPALRQVNQNATKVFQQTIGTEYNQTTIIRNFRQGNVNDCALLIQIYGLNRTSWGKEILKEHIKPDGMGGYIIYLNGAPTTQKTFRVSVEEIAKIREDQKKLPDSKTYNMNSIKGKEKYDNEYARLHKYSTGDDKLLVIEVAIEKCFAQMNRTLNNVPDIINLFDSEYKNQYIPIWSGADAKGILEDFKNNNDKYIMQISFKNGNSIGLESNHAYGIKRIETDRKGHTIIVLTNPWDSSKEIKKSAYEIITNAATLIVWKDSKTGNKSKTHNTEKCDFTKQEEHEKCRNENTVNIENQKRQFFQELNKILDTKDKQEKLSKLKNFFKNKDESYVLMMLYDNISSIITKIDKSEWGWGKGKNKKELISVLIEYVAEKAKEIGIKGSKIYEFEQKCKKELDTIFYIDEKVIISAFKSILKDLNNVISHYYE
ncbi:hypothetical protein IJ750_02045 [bacterium]|nr:hypothetical protein [bacterium]